MTHKKDHTDIINNGWIVRMPVSIQPYLYLMRLDRPIGTWLLLLPAFWAIILSGGMQWTSLILFSIGAIVMRGAGCVINDLWDRDLDSQVERTKARPLPSGAVSSRQALIFLAFLLLIGLAVLVQFNALTIMLGFAAVVFIVIYPYMKRITWWPQAFLGLTFNFGALMGWAAVTGELSWQAWGLYIGGFFWTLGYDTIYALQDTKDDALIGIKSSARWIVEKYPDKLEMILAGFYSIHFVIIVFVLVMDYIPNLWLFLVLVLPLGHLWWQVQTLEYDNPQNALQRFKSNRDYGLIICAIIILFHLSLG